MTVTWKEAMLKQLEQIVVDLMFLNLFPVPSSGKWTKTGPSTQRFVIGFLNAVFDSVVPDALGHLQFNTVSKEGELDTSFADWSQVAGKASTVCRSFLGCRNEKALVVILLIVDEVFRYLTLLYMAFSSCQSKFDPRKPSPIQILASDSRSPIYAALCHLSKLLAGKSSRLLLIFNFRGVADANEWLEKFPADCNVFFRACSACMATIERRQRARLATTGFQLFAMGDPDMPQHLVDDIAMRTARADKWQLSPGIEQRFWQHHQDKYDDENAGRLDKVCNSIAGDRQMLGHASWSISPSVFPCERLHM
jgi:hypothetical protein